MKALLHLVFAIVLGGALSACGGGSSASSSAAGPTPSLAPDIPQPSGAGPASAAAAKVAVEVTGDTQAAPNGMYAVVGTAPQVVVTLPSSGNLHSGDTVGVAGVGAGRWTLGQNPGQRIRTDSLPGNVAPATNWTARLQPLHWHRIVSNGGGDVLLAADNPGDLHLSTDAGRTWTTVPVRNAWGEPVVAASWIALAMTSDGSRMVAAAYGGGLFLSEDGGATFGQLLSGDVNLVDRAFKGASISDDGRTIHAAILDGPIVRSLDGGATWSAASSTTAIAFERGWRDVASSGSGSVVLAAEQSGELWISRDGQPFEPLPVQVDAAAIRDGWYRVAVSQDGTALAAAGNAQATGGAATGLYLSNDGGATWRRTIAVAGDYTALALSAHGGSIAATVSTPRPQALLSMDRGATFRAVDPAGGDAPWSAVALSADGDALALAAGVLWESPGQLFTSVGNRTTVGAPGSIGGGPGDAIVLRYLDGGEFEVLRSTGGPFEIR